MLKDTFHSFILRGCFTTMLFVFYTHAIYAQNISRGEYFFDADPGIGNGIQATVGTDNTFVANLTSVSDGVHTIYIRVQDATGYWSLASSRLFIKQSGGDASLGSGVRCEYFFDTDPGVGNGTTATIGSDNTFVADLSNLANGIHTLFVRVQDAAGLWSLTSTRSFLKQSGSGGAIGTIVRYEYFFDTDPGFGNGIEATLNSDLSFVADLTNVTTGLHQLYVRVQDAAGSWSLTHVTPFIRFNSANNSAASYEYFIDTDTGIGNGQTFTTDANGNATLPLDNITEGVHQLFVRAKDELGNWSLTHQKTFMKFNGIDGNAIARMEYFWDSDPGLGNGTAITGYTSVEGQSVVHEFSPNIDRLSTGSHVLYVRAKNNLGSWSLLHSGTIDIQRKGITVITHGFAVSGGFPDWVRTMANGIKDKSSSANIFKNDPETGKWVAESGNSNSANDEIILLYDWAALSNNILTVTSYGGNGYLESAADNLFALLNVTSLPGIGSVSLLDTDKPLHFIAHSRGNPLALQVFHRLRKYFPNKNIDQFTLLDPHPATTFGDVKTEESGSPSSLPCVLGSANGCSFTAGCNGANNIEIKVSENVKTADAYYRKDGTYEGASDIGNFDGVPVTGLGFNRELAQYWIKIPNFLGISFKNAHSNVHAWYYGTIKNTVNTTYDGINISDTEPELWYTTVIFPQNTNALAKNIIDGRRTKTGHSYSRLGGLGYPSAPTATTSLAEMESALTARTGSGLRPIFNGGFSYGDGNAGWFNNGGQSSVYNSDKVGILHNGVYGQSKIKHSFFYFAPEMNVNSTIKGDYTWLRFRIKTASSSRSFSIKFSSLTTVVQTNSTTITSPITNWSYVYCAIPNALKRNIGTFEVIDTDISLYALYVDDFEFTNATPSANDFRMGDPISLPLDLRSFIVQKQGTTAQLSWLTANEINTQYFDIEKSDDAQTWIKLGTQKAGDLKNYHFNDEKAFAIASIVYYRLKIVDNDGRFQYSPTRSLVNEPKYKMRLYPNPAKDMVTIELSSATENAPIDVTVQDITGKMLLMRRITTPQYQLDISQFPKGVYVVRANDKQGTYYVAEKLVIQ